MDHKTTYLTSFSIIIPCYNAKKTILTTIESVINQTYKALEIIVVDDQSTDDSIALITASFPSIKIYKTTENKGPSAARNLGWQVAKGDYVAFLDSDDHWGKEKLAFTKKIIDNHPNLLFFWHQFAVRGDTNSLNKEVDSIYKPNYFRLLLGNLVSTSCNVVLRTIPERFDETMRYCEDYDLAMRLCYLYPAQYFASSAILTFIDRPVLSLGGLSDNRWKMRKGEMKAYSNLRHLNKAFIVIIPVLWLGALMKHLIGKFRN